MVKTAAAVDVVLRKASAGLLQHQGLDQFQLGFHIPEIIKSVHVWNRDLAYTDHRCLPKVLVPPFSKVFHSQSWWF